MLYGSAPGSERDVESRSARNGGGWCMFVYSNISVTTVNPQRADGPEL